MIDFLKECSKKKLLLTIGVYVVYFAYNSCSCIDSMLKYGLYLTAAVKARN